MIILALDFETTGLSPLNDRIIEVGAILYSTSQQKCLESQGFLVKTDVPISAEITKLTGIAQAAVDKFGYESSEALDQLESMVSFAEAFVGQNVIRFDKKFYESWLQRDARYSLSGKLWVDIMTDLPGVEGKHLGYQAADHGFLNLFPHSALTDSMTVLKILEKYDIEKVVERAKSPVIVLQAHQSRADNELAKKRKFRWSPFYKIWWKGVKEQDFESEIKAASFSVTLAPKEVLIEKLFE